MSTADVGQISDFVGVPGVEPFKAIVPSDLARAAEPMARVLVVEDDSRSRRMLETILVGAGYKVILADSAKAAQQFALQEFPDLIVSDIGLAGMDGIELTAWFRGQQATAHVPILLVTSLDESNLLSRGLEAGADDFLPTPLNSLELRTRIRSLLKTKFLAEEIRAREQAALRFAAQERTREPEPAGGQVIAELDLASTSILIVDDNEQESRAIEVSMRELGGATTVVRDAKSALECMHEHLPNLVILDLVLPDQSGYQLIEQIKGDPGLGRIPILVVSSVSQAGDRVKALELGADDFIVKGFDRIEFHARACRLLRLAHSLNQLSQRCDQALRLAITDSLTHLFTHGFLQESLQRYLASACRQRAPLSLLFVDIDHFKQVNDRYGHSVGDQVLKLLAQTLRDNVRQGDIAVRYGGEEFVVLLPHAARHEAIAVATRVRAAVESLSVPIPSSVRRALKVTVSIGIAGFPDDALDASSLVQRADEAMYLAKQAGRNTIVVFGASPQNGQARRILLVDDGQKNLRQLQEYLEPEGYQIFHARDGEEAIASARSSKPDLIVLDATASGLSSFDACRRLKREAATALIPVMLVTTVGSREDRLRGIEAGADDFLVTPIDKVELLTQTRALLRVKSTTDLLEDAETVIFTLARAVEAREPMSGDHIERVSRYAVALGKAVGLNEAQVNGLRRAGMVHDIGKIVVPDAVLLKRGPLTAEERIIMERHVEAGYELLRPMRTFSESLAAVRFHHERRDGSGYPFGLSGDQIPLSAQILAVVDVFDAVTSLRVYRQALSQDEAYALLREEAARGLHDPNLVETFITLLEQRNVMSATAAMQPR